MRHLRIYFLWSIILILLAYIVPYTILKSGYGFTLYLFWVALALVHVIDTWLFIEKYWG